MLKTVLHVLASSERIDTPFLVVMVLPVWDNTPWNSATIKDHRNISTLIRIPTGHMRFVPTHRQSDESTATHPPAKWLVEMVLISNEAGREQYLDQTKIHRILAPTILDVCRMTPAIMTKFLPRTNTNSQGAQPLQGRHPTRPIPRCPAKNTTTGPPTRITAPKRQLPGASSSYVPNLRETRPHRFPHVPLRVVELCGGLATGLEALLQAGYAIISYAWVDTDPDAHTAASQRVAYLRHKFPHLLPPEAVHD
jgi:hypothetical protein